MKIIKEYFFQIFVQLLPETFYTIRYFEYGNFQYLIKVNMFIDR